MKESQRFLIVDDDIMVRSVLQALFDHHGLECTTAVNGRHAVEKWEKEDFCAILMDLDMPVMDGLCACREIRQQERKKERNHTPIIAVSARDMKRGKAESLEAGMNDFVLKPFTMDELCSIVFPLAGLEYSNMMASQKVRSTAL